jgi:threonine/homoserine/homoserine lactone efflux protein
MPVTDIALYFVMLASLTVAPGPLMVLLVARTMGNDAKGALGLSIGIALGDLFIVSVVCLGLGLWLQSVPAMFETARALMLAYIAWLAVKMWRGTGTLGDGAPVQRAGFWASVGAGSLICVVSPQTLMIYTLLLPSIVDLENVTPGAFTTLVLVTFAAIAASLCAIVLFAGQLRRLMRDPAHMARVNKVLALAVGGSGVWIAFG